MSVRRSVMIWYCFRSSCYGGVVRAAVGVGELNVLFTSSSSAFRCLNLSRWLVTIGKMDASAEFDVNGIGVVRAGDV
jgi:hypothetical protein